VVIPLMRADKTGDLSVLLGHYNSLTICRVPLGKRKKAAAEEEGK
jgi:hypothetical protein